MSFIAGKYPDIGETDVGTETDGDNWTCLDANWLL
jgi:hypothetical protein